MAACSCPWALNPAAVCNDTGSAAGGTSAVIAEAAAACAAASRAVRCQPTAVPYVAAAAASPAR